MAILKSFKDLKKLNSVKVATFKPYTNEEKIFGGISVYINNNDEPAHIANTIIRKYKNAIKHNKKRVNDELRPLYGRDLIFKDNITTEMVLKVKNVMLSTGKSIKEIANDFRKYLGYPCTFFRKEGNRQIPVDSARLLKAYKAMKEKKLIYEIEKILFE